MSLKFLKVSLAILVLLVNNMVSAEVVKQGGTGSSGAGNITLSGGTVVDVSDGAYFTGSTSPASDWVWDSANSTGSGNPLTFTFTFSLSGYDSATAAIAGSWGVDNAGSVSLNGTQITSLSNTAAQNYSQLHALSVGTGSSLFVAGENVLTFTVVDLGLPGALRASIEVTADRADPTNTPIFSPADGVLGGQIDGTSFDIGVAGGTRGENNWPSNEGPEHFIDGVGQKYLNFGEFNTGVIVSPTLGCSVASSIKFWTANDNVPRDPTSYKLYGTNNEIDNSSNPLSSFTLISEGNLSLPNSRNANGTNPLDDANSQTISFSNSEAYASYLVVFPTVKNSNGANSMQIGEVQLFGRAQSCPITASPIAEYWFDELSWRGAANEVIDSSGNSNNGTAIGGISTEPGKICHAANIPVNNSASIYEAVDTDLDLDTRIGSKGTISLWYKGDDAWNSGSDKRLFDATDGNKYFLAEIAGDGRVKFWFEDGQDGDYQKTTSTAFSVNAGVWKHLTFVWDVSSRTAKVYVDGVDQSLTGGDGGTNAFIGYDSLYIGDNRDASYFTGESSASGLIDEVLIFDTPISANEVETIFTNQNAGNNYDGTPRTCPPTITPLLEYHFEEDSWNGTANEILDHSGNGHHARLHNNSTPETDTPALTGDPGTCGYASLNDGSIQVTNLPIDTTTPGVKTTVTFWMNWDGTNNVMPIGWNFHDIWIVNGSFGFNTWNSDVYGISSAGLANGWHHVAVEFTNGSVTSNRIHIDGVEQVLTQRRSRPNNRRAFVNSQMRVGGVSNSSFYDFHGLLDEFRVYESALSTAEINTIMAERHDCGSPVIHHYEISHDGQGLTCDVETFTVKACVNESCSNLSSESVTLDVLADGAIISSPTFTGSTNISFNHTTAETLTLSIANASLAASNPIECKDGSGNSCDITFANAGFRFLYDTDTNETIANQTSGVAFADVLKLQAVKDTNGVCTGIFSGNKTIGLAQENVNPSGISGLKFTINGDAIDKHTGSLFTPITLNFGTDSKAIIPSPIYHDAGQIRLRANYSEAGVTLSGASNAFWVQPAELIINAMRGTTELNGLTANASPTHKAGENFTLSVTAYNGATPKAITQNYTPGQIEFKLTRTGPLLADSVDGTLHYNGANSLISDTSATFQNVTLNGFSGGVSTYNAAYYSEVGLLNLDAQDSNYGNENIVIDANAKNIGRFIPDHFQQTLVEEGHFVATCNSGTTFAYFGQKDEATDSIGAISYLTNPVIAITAYNKQGVVTQNYFQDSEGSNNDYMKLSAADVQITAPTLDEVAVGVDGNKLPLTSNMMTGILSQNDITALPSIVALPKGTLHYQFSDDDNFFYQRSANALVRPFTMDVIFQVGSIEDGDNVRATVTDVAAPGGVEIRFGRLAIENTFGPETQNFPQPMQTQHYDGSQFIVSTNNNCVGYDESNISLTNISLNPALTPVFGGTGNFLNGQTQSLQLTAPGAGNTGQIGVSYDIFDWLKYDWNNDGVYDNNPEAVATFGIFRGNDRIISWREVSN